MSTQKIPVAAEAAIEVRRVGGDLRIQGWDQAELQARGDAVRIEKGETSAVVDCGGDLELSMPRGARLVVSRIAGDTTIEDLSGSVEIGLVGGDATLRNLSGTVAFTGPIAGETHTENVTHFSMKPGGAGPDFDIRDRLQEHVRRKVEHATRRAAEHVRKAEQKAYRQAQFRAHYADGTRWRWDAAAGASPSDTPSEPVTGEERMLILRMLQEKKITSEQAEQLLAALEGNA